MPDFRTRQEHGARRRFLSTALAMTGATGAVAVVIPFVRSWQPSARAAGAPVQLDPDALAPGQQIMVTWRRNPVWVLRRAPAMRERPRSPELAARLQIKRELGLRTSVFARANRRRADLVDGLRGRHTRLVFVGE